MNLFKNVKIGTRLNVIMSGFIVIAFASFGIYVNGVLQNQIISSTDERMMEQVLDLAEVISVEILKNQEKVDIAINAASALFAEKGSLTQTDEIIRVNATNQETRVSSTVSVPLWLHGDTRLQDDYSFVDAIQSLGIETATVFQKIPQGYLRISTNVLNADGGRAVGTYIPSGTAVAQAIDRGQRFQGRAWVVNDWFLTAYEPIILNGQVQGMIYTGVREKDLRQIKELFNNKKYFDTGYPYLVASDGTLIVHPDSEGTDITSYDFFQTMLRHKNNRAHRDEYVWQGDDKVQYYTYIEAIDSFVAANFYTAEMNSILSQLRLAIIGITILIVVLVMIVLRVIVQSVVTALKKGVEFADRMASGDLTATIDIDQKDEIGILALALLNMAEKLKDIIENVKAGAENIASAGVQMSSASQQLSQGSNEQASAAEEVSSSMEEMAANIQQNTDNASQAEKISLTVSQGVQKVGTASQQSLESIRNIADKIVIINDIAFQTNILALNAAVEAARAGEHGRGFAVVAAEVRKLAERSKLAADEIVSLAGKSVNVTESAGELLGSLIPEIEKTSRLVQEIAAASNEQNSGADQINNAIQQLNQVTQQNAASSEELATSAEELSSQADQLKDVIAFFRIDEQGVRRQAPRHQMASSPKQKPLSTIKLQEPKSSKGVILKGFEGKPKENDGFEKF